MNGSVHCVALLVLETQPCPCVRTKFRADSIEDTPPPPPPRTGRNDPVALSRCLLLLPPIKQQRLTNSCKLVHLKVESHLSLVPTFKSSESSSPPSSSEWRLVVGGGAYFGSLCSFARSKRPPTKLGQLYSLSPT